MHPSDLRFTQDNIGVTFKAPFDSTRIDDAVDMIISGQWTASTFACICVVEVDGVLFSLDNRRLWVFRKAALSSITVYLKKAHFNHPRLQAIRCNRRTLKMMKSESFFPRMRGKVRQMEWWIPAALNVERSILITWAKEHQLPPPVHKVSEVDHFSGVSRISVDGASGERATSTETIDIGKENSAQNAVTDGLLELLKSKALKHIDDLHCDEQRPPLQHPPVQNDTSVSADLEQGDVQMISTDSMPFQSSSQQWWNSYFGLMIDRAWNCAKGAVQTIWSYVKSKFPRW